MTLRPLPWLILLLLPVLAPANTDFPASALEPREDPAAVRLGKALTARLQSASGRQVMLPAVSCRERKRWSKNELLAVAPTLPGSDRFALLSHLNDDPWLAKAGILLLSGALCNCPPYTGPVTDVGITKTASLPTVTAGQPFSYTLQVTNYGPNTASSTSLSDTLPATLSFVSSTPGSPTCTLGGALFSCNFGSLAVGGSRTVTLDVTVSPTAGGSLANTATVSTATPDTYSPNNSQTAVITVTPLQPGRVPDVLLLMKNGLDPTQLDFTWTASCGNTVTGYGVYEGTLGSFYSHAPLNAQCNLTATSLAAQAPGAGNRYYLVAPRSALAEGSYGLDSNSLELPPSGAACVTPQVFGGVCP